MAASTRRASTKPVAAPVEEPDEDEFEEMEETDDDLEELEDEPEETPAPKAKGKKAAAATGDKPKRTPPVRPTIQFSSAWLASYITEKTGETYDARGVRMLLRKMARDGSLKRVIGETRDRYEFTGPDDPKVAAVLAMVTSGEAKELKQAGLQAVKDKAAEKRAAAKAAKEATAPVEADEEDDDDDIEEEPEEAPKPRTRRAAPAKAAPAKATAAPRTRRAAAK